MQFLFENPILIFLLIGLISSIFKRSKGEEKQKQRPKRPAQPIRPVQREPMSNSETSIPEEVDSRPMQRTQAQRQELRKAQPNPQSALLDIQKKYEERKKQEHEASRSTLNRPLIQPEATKESASLESSMQLKPEADRLIEGIAWAQILGEPRSKKPHRTMRRY